MESAETIVFDDGQILTSVADAASAVRRAAAVAVAVVVFALRAAVGVVEALLLALPGSGDVDVGGVILKGGCEGCVDFVDRCRRVGEQLNIKISILIPKFILKRKTIIRLKTKIMNRNVYSA